MKAFKLIALCAASAAILCSCCGGKSASGSQPKGITREDVKNASYMIGYNFGQILKGYLQVQHDNAVTLVIGRYRVTVNTGRFVVLHRFRVVAEYVNVR